LVPYGIVCNHHDFRQKLLYLREEKLLIPPGYQTKDRKAILVLPDHI
jgi:hypothetical protein